MSEEIINALLEENKLLLNQLKTVQENLETAINKIKEYQQNKLYPVSEEHYKFIINFYENEFEKNNKKIETLQKENTFTIDQNALLRNRLNDEIEKNLKEIKNSNGLVNFIYDLWKNNIKLEIELKILKDFFKEHKEIENKGNFSDKIRDKLTDDGRLIGFLVESYYLEGLDNVRQSLSENKITKSRKAIICTKIAKQILPYDKVGSVNFAKLAWCYDPRWYRYKWMLLRMCDAGQEIKASCLASYLPDNIKINTVESAKLERSRYRAKKILANEFSKEIEYHKNKKTRYDVKNLSNIVEKNFDLKRRYDTLEIKINEKENDILTIKNENEKYKEIIKMQRNILKKNKLNPYKIKKA